MRDKEMPEGKVQGRVRESADGLRGRKEQRTAESKKSQPKEKTNDGSRRSSGG